MLRRLSSNPITCAITLFIFYGYRAYGASLDCTFDHSFCEWNQETSDDFNWTRQNENTKSRFTGPSSDHTTGDSDGYYIYIEASHPRKKGDKARLISPMQEPGPQCFMFWYSLHGMGIGTLNIHLVPNYTVVFTKSGSFGNRKWRTEALSYSAPTKYQIVIEGIRGQDAKGDIAVDDISMTPGMCTLNCTFDSGLCLWKQDNTDDFDWAWKKGATSAGRTGPLADHTSGHGYYIYIDSSEAGRNEKARVISPLQSAGKYCISIWYYMYGIHGDTLRILKIDEESETTELLMISGNQGSEWIQKMAFINSRMRFRIMIEGIAINRHQHYLGDIAVDDIMMISCQDCSYPIVKYGKINSTNFRYGSHIEVTCDTGYIISGNPLTYCQSSGKWTDIPTCEQTDCSYPIVHNGKINSTNFRYGSHIEVTCDKGYIISGNPLIYCQSSGKWTDIPTCEQIDCRSRTIANGEFSAQTGTTSWQIATQTCKAGYILMGDPMVTCIESGWNGSAGTCDIVDSTNIALIPVYAVVPVAAVALVTAVLFIIFRRRSNRSPEDVSQDQMRNETYTDLCNTLGTDQMSCTQSRHVYTELELGAVTPHESKMTYINLTVSQTDKNLE